MTFASLRWNPTLIRASDPVSQRSSLQHHHTNASYNLWSLANLPTLVEIVPRIAVLPSCSELFEAHCFGLTAAVLSLARYHQVLTSSFFSNNMTRPILSRCFSHFLFPQTICLQMQRGFSHLTQSFLLFLFFIPNQLLYLMKQSCKSPCRWLFSFSIIILMQPFLYNKLF